MVRHGPRSAVVSEPRRRPQVARGAADPLAFPEHHVAPGPGASWCTPAGSHPPGAGPGWPWLPRRQPREAHLPAEQPPPRQAPRLPPPHVRPRRPCGDQGSAAQGPQAPLGVATCRTAPTMPTAVQGPPVARAAPELWRITDRRTFQALRQQGRRARRGPLTVTWLPPDAGDAATPPRAGFAVGTAGRRRGAAEPGPPPPAGGPARARRPRAGSPPAPTSSAAAPSWPTLPWSELVELVEATIAEARR